MANGRRWYVVHSQPHNEIRADAHLRRQGFETYLPRHLRKRRHARKTEIVVKPLFPRYLFVALNLNFDRWRAVHSTIGVSQLVTAGDAPIAVPDGVVDEIRAREDESGFVRLSLPAGVGPGSSVRLVDNIFADAVGVLERIADERRVAVLLQLLGRKVRVFVPTASIRAA
jgi:transcriptional antiterminator RfaH